MQASHQCILCVHSAVLLHVLQPGDQKTVPGNGHRKYLRKLRLRSAALLLVWLRVCLFEVISGGVVMRSPVVPLNVICFWTWTVGSVISAPSTELY